MKDFYQRGLGLNFLQIRKNIAAKIKENQKQKIAQISEMKFINSSQLSLFIQERYAHWGAPEHKLDIVKKK
jgi:hypothetical protein